jgi:ferritin
MPGLIRPRLGGRSHFAFPSGRWSCLRKERGSGITGRVNKEIMNKIAAKVLTELNRQFNQELKAAHSYRALALWCDERNYKGFAGFFAKQSGEELVHAGKISEHLIDRGQTPELAAIAAPKQSFKSLLEVAQHAQTMESENTKGVDEVYEAALGAKDYPAQVLMHWFIKEQVEEEAWALEMVERVQAATCAGGTSDLDRHIERYLEADTKSDES